MQTSQQIITAVSTGIAFALCIGLLMFLVRRNPRKAKKIAVSFLSVEVQSAVCTFKTAKTSAILYIMQVLLILKISSDGLDFFTESVLRGQ